MLRLFDAAEAAGAGAAACDARSGTARGLGAAVAVDGAVLGGGTGPPAGEPWQATPAMQRAMPSPTFEGAGAEV